MLSDWRNPRDRAALVCELQTGPEVVWVIPGLGGVAELANAGISLARGNYGEAALSLAAMVPFAGAAATAGKFAKKARKFIAKERYTRNVAQRARHIDWILP